ncbi:Med26 domain-containing protein [Cephalotus follicularis]|uniref:Med26 domain-containing protein n=1 Tax=Cephalotus follicularis TaxID=3775 RepID=A0A1Q3B0H1_CEPFO|nr:Med26 domain-containing protein [Cephalotus follicularis]
MAMKSLSANQWRNYFRTASSDIFQIIENAIVVAALDCPKEFMLRRDRIAEKLFTCRLTRCLGCDRVELAVPGLEEEYEDENDNRGCKSSRDDGLDGGGVFDNDDDVDVDIMRKFEAAGGSKESKVNSVSRGDDHDDDLGEMNMNQIVSNYSFGEAEALTDEIEEESQIIGEVLRIKEFFHNSQNESDSVLFDSLRKLQLMSLTVDTLKATEIGKAVNCLRKHRSKQIRHLARTLIDGWKDLVDEWVNATKSLAGAEEGTPESLNPYILDEEGLPSPPLDEGVFFATQTMMELSQFFDGMDDDGNPRNSGEFIKNRESRRKSSLDTQNIIKCKQQDPNDANVLAKDNRSHQMGKREGVVKPYKPSNTDSESGRPLKITAEPKVSKESKAQQKPDKVSLQKRPPSGQQDKFNCSDEVAVQRKLEATKRKLQERYQQAENAKKQRTIQVMELHDLPKQGLGQKNSHMRHGNHIRQWPNGRRSVL